MSLLRTITAAAVEANLKFLIAGGHAVIAHGYPRTTFDVDLIIPRDARGLNYMKRPNESAATGDLRPLELPDWSGMDQRPHPVEPEHAFDLLEHYPEWFPKAAERARNARPPKCEVEFSL